MSTTISYAPNWGPDLELTVDDDGGISCTITLDEFEPTRDTNAEERSIGITSLDPPTVSVRARSTRYATHRAFIDACKLAVLAATEATDGESGGPAGMLMSNIRVGMAVRHALRLAGEDV